MNTLDVELEAVREAHACRRISTESDSCTDVRLVCRMDEVLGVDRRARIHNAEGKDKQKQIQSDSCPAKATIENESIADSPDHCFHAFDPRKTVPALLRRTYVNTN